MDETLRDLERELVERGYADVVRYVNAARRAGLSQFDTPVQSAPLWARFSVPPGGRADDRLVVPGYGDNLDTSFEVIGLSVLFDVATPKDAIARAVDGGLLVLTDGMVGTVSEIPLRMAVAWPWPVDQPPGASLPAMRRTGTMRQHDHMTISLILGGDGTGPSLNGTFVLHGVRRGTWRDDWRGNWREE